MGHRAFRALRLFTAGTLALGFALAGLTASSGSALAAITPALLRPTHWSVQHRHALKPHTERVIDFALAPGKTKILRHGVPGLSETVVFYTRENGKIRKRVVTRILRAPKTRVIAKGVGAYTALAQIATRELRKSVYIAAREVDMVATAYTAGCMGCTGYTKMGGRAGKGIVAVDPRVIPLGTRLYIPGYGFAVAADTGGAIIGHRIDLGFDSLTSALQFGRRAMIVYMLK